MGPENDQRSVMFVLDEVLRFDKKTMGPRAVSGSGSSHDEESATGRSDRTVIEVSRKFVQSMEPVERVGRRAKGLSMIGCQRNVAIRVNGEREE